MRRTICSTSTHGFPPRAFALNANRPVFYLVKLAKTAPTSSTPASTMIIPIRCFTCGKVIADKWEAYEALVKHFDAVDKAAEGAAAADDETGTAADDETGDAGKSAVLQALERLHIDRMCCRRHFMTNLHIVDQL